VRWRKCEKWRSTAGMGRRASWGDVWYSLYRSLADGMVASNAAKLSPTAWPRTCR
jgi:hypothetical protein